MKKTDKKIKLFDFNIFSRPKKELLKIIKNHFESTQELLVIFTPNPEQIMLAKRDKSFADLLGFATILIPDGIGLVLASRLAAVFSKKQPIAERITGVDLATDIISLASNYQQKILLVGGQNYQASTSKEVQEITVENHLVFWTPGYATVSQPQKAEEQKLMSQIKMLQPEVVFVAFGAPEQEKWVYDHRQLLEKNGVKLVMVVGGAFDMLLGKIRRAPQWMQVVGLEWLYRLIQEPWRVRRQLQLLPFLALTVKTAFSSTAKKP